MVQSHKDHTPAEQCAVSKRCILLSEKDREQGLGKSKDSNHAAVIRSRALLHGTPGLQAVQSRRGAGKSVTCVL